MITFSIRKIDRRTGETVVDWYNSLDYSLAEAVAEVERILDDGGEAEIYDGNRIVMEAGQSSAWRCVRATASPFRRLPTPRRRRDGWDFSDDPNPPTYGGCGGR
jgi:hypothetical protein